MKAWILTKCILALVLGAIMISGIIETTLGVSGMCKLIAFVSTFIWLRYVLNFYYPERWAR